MLFKEFLTEINSNKTKQNLRKPTITDRQTKVKRKKPKGQTMIYKTLHR
jgi:hypothetical protein